MRPVVEVPLRTLAPGQRCQVWTRDADGGDPVLRYETGDVLLEAPNWLPDGDLLLNGDGGLWRLSPAGELTAVPLYGVPALNNDHVPHPSGAEVFVSANDFDVYRVPAAGGAAVRVTSERIPGLLHFLHGVSPDGSRLAFTGVTIGDRGFAAARADIYTVGVDGEDYRRLTDGPGPSDGSEFTPDGAWLLYNTEAFDGHAQIARMRIDGTDREQLTRDDRVNWFPHAAPDGSRIVYLSYPPGTAGHPADLPVELRLVTADDWSAPVTVASLFGGQGTINVNSWAPDSSAFAYVAYPLPG
ncbi:biopolymer transporter Tol [Microbacterium sp. X-17]|uniref:TolB family protein n=1 Tax=Microbacterium sp. X-17 TaxID=3144404 RepID=UPI0031F49997